MQSITRYPLSLLPGVRRQCGLQRFVAMSCTSWLCCFFNISVILDLRERRHRTVTVTTFSDSMACFGCNYTSKELTKVEFFMDRVILKLLQHRQTPKPRNRRP